MTGCRHRRGAGNLPRRSRRCESWTSRACRRSRMSRSILGGRWGWSWISTNSGTTCPCRRPSGGTRSAWLIMWHAALSRLGLRVMILRPGMEWPQQFPIVVAPGVQMIDDDLLKRMESYARRGKSCADLPQRADGSQRPGVGRAGGGADRADDRRDDRGVRWPARRALSARSDSMRRNFPGACGETR